MTAPEPAVPDVRLSPDGTLWRRLGTGRWAMLLVGGARTVEPPPADAVRLVPASGFEPPPAEMTTGDAVAANKIAAALIARFGFVPLSVRYQAAWTALAMVRAWHVAHPHPDALLAPVPETQETDRD